MERNIWVCSTGVCTTTFHSYLKSSLVFLLFHICLAEVIRIEIVEDVEGAEGAEGDEHGMNSKHLLVLLDMDGFILMSLMNFQEQYK